MLREYNRIAREMLFLHGHLTRPQDWAETAAAKTTPRGRPAKGEAKKRAASRGFAATAAACGIVIPTRLIVGQLR